LGSDAILTPAGKSTLTGLVWYGVSWPSPSSAKLFTPQANTSPADVSAYPSEFDVAICTTFPAMPVTAAGAPSSSCAISPWLPTTPHR
jgi:hypothetical protein